MPSAKARLQTYESGAYLRQRLVFSTLSGTPIRVTNIRADDAEKPGLSPAEVSFLRLLDKLSAGASIAINDTGTTLTYRPGLLLGGGGDGAGAASEKRLSHDCHPSRAVAYYVEPLLQLAPFCARPLRIALHGATAGASHADADADALAAAAAPLLHRLSGGAVAASLDVKRRAFDAAGLVIFQCAVAMNRLPPADLAAPAQRVRRVRGVAYGVGVAPALVARMVDRARGLLNRFCADVWVRTDVNSATRRHHKRGDDDDEEGGDNNGANARDARRGFGISLSAELRDGAVLAADWASGTCRPATPEQVADAAVACLLEEVEAGGTVDSVRAPQAIAWCAAAAREVSRVRAGRLSAACVETLRDAERLLGVRFRLRVRGGALGNGDGDDGDDCDDEADDADDGGDDQGDHGYGTVLSCVGAGVANVARRRF